MRLWVLAAAVNGFLAVAMGALAVHALRGRLDEQALGWIETGARYELGHALALLGVAALAARAGARARALDFAGWAFLLGTVLFSGMLYAMALTGWRMFGAVVPFGGVAYLAGWAALFVYGLALRRGAAGEASSRWPSTRSRQ